MAEHFTQNFIDLSNGGFCPNRTAELGLYHREGTLHIRPLMIMSQELFPVEVVEVPHSMPQAVITSSGASHTPSVALEWDVGSTAYGLDCMKVTAARVGFVCRHLIDCKCLGGLIHQGNKLDCISRFICGSFNTGNDVSFYSTHNVGFYKSLLTAVAVFMVIPSGVCCGGKPRGINSKVHFNYFQRAGTLLYKAFKQWSQFGILQITECTIIVGGLTNHPVFLSLFQLAGKSPAGHSAVGLEHQPEHDIGQWQTGTAKPVLWLLNAITEVMEQGYKVFLFMGLSLIIGCPFLSTSHSDRLGIGGTAVWLSFSLNYVLNGMDMFAGQMPFLKIGAGAKRLAVVKTHEIVTITRLGRDFPAQSVFLNPTCCRYYQPSFLSRIHFFSPGLLFTDSIYYKGLTCQYLRYIFLVNIFRSYLWEIITKNQELLPSQLIGVVVDMNGFLVIQMSVLECVLNVKVQIGINQRSLLDGKVVMSCNIGQYLPADDSPITEVERVIHLQMLAYPGRQRGRRRRLLPPQEMELVVITQEGKTLSLSGVFLPELGSCYLSLSQGKTVFREFHAHEGHKNPKRRNHPITQLHMHFPTTNFPLIEYHSSYAYSLGEADFDNVEDCIKFMCIELDINVVEYQPKLRSRGDKNE